MRAIVEELYLVPVTELTVDSTSLQSLYTSIKEPAERFNKVDLSEILEAVDDGHLHAVHWCPGTKILADALTKDNRVTALLLLAALANEKHERPLEMATNLGRAAP